MKHIFIVNPESGNQKGLVAGKIIDEYCKKLNIDYQLIYTTGTNHAMSLARMYSNCHDCIIYSVGGDGTLNEIVNGMPYSKASLKVIPVGSGNDFYKCIENQTIIDLGKVNDRYFINIASLGIDAYVAETANSLKQKGISSNFIYIGGIVKNLFQFKSIELYQDESIKELMILAFCNGRYYGGGFQIAPYANLNDGLFDIYEVEKLNKIRSIQVLSKLLKGTHTSDTDVHYYKMNKITVESDYRLPCNVDGEVFYHRHFDFEIVPNAIRLEDKNDIKIYELLKSKKIIK